MTKPTPKELKRQIKQLRQRISATRKAIEAREGEDTSDLLEQNRVDSADLKLLEKSLKQQLNKVCDSNEDEIKALIPPAFEPLQKRAGTDFTIIEADLESQGWQEFSEKHTRTTSCHGPALLNAIHQAYQHDAIVLLAKEGDAILGVLPIVILDSPIFGRYGASIPYFNYGGPLTHYSDVAEALIAYCKTLLTEYQLKHILIRTCLEGLPFSCSTDKASMILPLPSNSSALDGSLGSKVRSQVKKAGDNSFSFETGHSDLLDDFHKVLSENMRDLGSPFHGKTFFTHLLNQLGERCILAVAYLDDHPVSAGLLVASDTTLEIPWASTTRSGNRLNANMWFYHQVLTYAVEHNFAFFDFGRSSIDAGTFKFKKQWGANPVQHYWYTISNTQQSSAAPAAKEFGLLVKCWQQLPVWLARPIGAYIIRGIA
ncbi:GNAT family N-acetyltransferase [Simiduia agarivorans]|uniref:BioF2-like acetyltransferase domain-containing protein n=1 Tax=Simiduia agarivorans (strain DSM 21679 / JCM 13881 / BCRC 17597 / SA1) TaxID=1117647 RepID=K4KYD8_SIMAS|nr:GNAT family N-acetyltransferase [Simiduia agarivorans]AFU98962.1 hypothetical protein M5M_08875 [Simiduia agarivorans SA1 = DSM 21679]